jgi:hypothetical protein
MGGSSILKKSLEVILTGFLGYYFGDRQSVRTELTYGVFTRDMQILGSLELEVIEVLY